jgi:aryl-alcohol dehydrogenase-like predicted oxidoreductase
VSLPSTGKDEPVTQTATSVHASGTFRIGGDLEVHRLGFGAMQLTGQGIWGEPRDRDECIRVLRRAVELGVDLIDTADSYGPFVSEELIREALHPYPDGLVIATKGGLTRAGPGDWRPVGRPAYLRQCVEMSLRRLDVERIDLYQLHRVDPATPMEESLGELRAMQGEGKIRHIGVSEVDVATVKSMREIVPVVSVQNLYNLTERRHEDVVDYCEQEGIGFIPWFPLATGALAKDGGVLARMADSHAASAPQLALAWLLRRSPVMLPIPGTSSVAHLEENCAAADVQLTDDEYADLASLQGE